MKFYGEHRHSCGAPEGSKHGAFTGRPRLNRILGHGDIRYLILALLSEKPSYGYELMKAIEDKLHGAYTPSPGLIYPTLNMLEEMTYVSAEGAENGKKIYSITEQGRTFLDINKHIVDKIMGRMEQAAAMHSRTEAPQIVRAVENLNLALKLKRSTKALTEEQIQSITAALDQAARTIEQC